METLKDVLDMKGRRVFSIRPGDTVDHALRVLADGNIGALLVIKESGELAGVFSERDFTRNALSHRDGIFSRPVSEFMSTRIRWAPSSMTIEQCMGFMTSERVRHLPVYEGEVLDGVISIGDVVKATLGEKDLMIEQLEHYIESSL